MKKYTRENNYNEFNTIYAMSHNEVLAMVNDNEKVMTMKEQRAHERAVITGKKNRLNRLAIRHGFKNLKDAIMECEEERKDIWKSHHEYHKPNADDDLELDMWLNDHYSKWQWLIDVL